MRSIAPLRLLCGAGLPAGVVKRPALLQRLRRIGKGRCERTVGLGAGRFHPHESKETPLGVALRGHIPTPQLSKLPMLIEKIGSQDMPAAPDCQSCGGAHVSLQQTLRMNLRHPIHERRPESVHGIPIAHFLAKQVLHDVIRLPN